VKWCWFWAASACFILSAASAHGQAAALLQKQANDDMSRGDYAGAAKAYDTIVTTYPSTPNIEIITISAGYAFLHSNDYLKAVSELAKLTGADVKPEFRGKALFFTGLAQFSQAHLLSDQKKDADSKEEYKEAQATLTTLIDFINKDRSPDNLDLLENAMYYQALCAYGQDNYDESEADLDALLAKFPASLQKPDYLLLLGSIYAVQASNALTAKQPIDQVNAIAAKATGAFDAVLSDPNAKVQGNEAYMREGEIDYLLAQAEPEDYAKALDLFRHVLRKDDMIAVQQARIGDLQAAQANSLQGAGANASTVSNQTALVLDRETARLADLKAGPDPIIEALLRMAECYIGMKQPDEARTILHRLSGASLPPDQQQELDFQLLYSYTLGGQAEKADAALTDYLAKHPGDPQADSISVQIADALMKRTPPDYEGALRQTQRSLKDFPNGKHVDAAVTLEAAALEKLGRVDESKHVIDDFVKNNPDNPLAYAMLVTQGEGQMQTGDLTGALATFGKVKDNPKAAAYQASADAFYVQVLNMLRRYPEVASEAKNFETKFPADKALPSVEVLGAMAMDKQNDPGAVAILQGVAKQFHDQEEIASFALYYVVAIYERQQKAPEMLQAAKDLATSFPTAYGLISQANDAVVVVLEKQKKFDDAVALYQPLLTAPLKEVAAGAQVKIGDIWLAAAKAMGAYQSLQTDVGRQEAEKRMAAAESAYVAVLQNFSGQTGAVGDALQGLTNTGTARVKWGLLKDSDLEGYLAKQGADLTTPEMQARLELAKAGLVFVIKNGHRQDAAALDRMTKALAASPGLALTTQEADQYGQLLIGAKNYPQALQVFQALLATAKPTEQLKLAEAYYGLGATYLAQGDYANAKTWFVKMLSLPGGAAWSTHANDAQLAMAEINEQSTSPDDLAAAKAAYSSIMVSPVAGAANQAAAMLGYGRLLEKAGHAVKAAGQADIEFATHYYEQVDLFYGPALPDLSAEGLYLAGQAYAKAGDTADATRVNAKLKATYPTTSWAAKVP
jgi:outer membrane protein assembly factor BamD (BamD/ComL family)